MARVDLQSDVVRRMEAQHERVAASLDRVMRALPAWQASASTPAGTVSWPHSPSIAPSCLNTSTTRRRTCSRWPLVTSPGRNGTRRASTSWPRTPRRQLLTFLGAVLEDADAGERASVLTALPALPRWIWRIAGQRIYARRMRRLRGRP